MPPWRYTNLHIIIIIILFFILLLLLYYDYCHNHSTGTWSVINLTTKTTTAFIQESHAIAKMTALKIFKSP